MTYFFQEGIPADVQADFDIDIFHQLAHVDLQSSSEAYSFSMVDHNGKRLLALVYFHIVDELAYSPIKSPFGSYLFSSSLSEDELYDFIAYTDARLKHVGVKKIILKNAPDSYAPKQYHRLAKVLNKHHYHLHREETSALIPINNHLFQLHLHRAEKKRLRKCKANGLLFEFVPLDQLSEIYTFLKFCKEEKGYEISMTLEQLMKVTSRFPDYFMLTRVTQQGALVAGNISIKVNQRVLYNFYHDHHRSFNTLSPVVFLNEGLYQFCQQNGYQWLDLGTSMLNGVIKTSLVDFKLRLGAQPSPKLTFVKKIV